MKAIKTSVLFTLCTLLAVLLLGAVPAGAVAQSDITLAGDAYYDDEQGHYVLTEETPWQGGALWFNQVRCNDNFSISMDFYTGHADHVDSYGGADGICVAFYAKGGQAGEQGQGLGFDGCGGYGVEIDTYQNSDENDPKNNHIAIIQGTVGNHVQVADASGFTEDGKWHHLQITNRRGVCTVFVDGTQVLQQADVTPNGQYEIGITGATGSGYNYHAVKNIELDEAVWKEASPWADDELTRAQEKGLIPEVLYDQDLTRPITRAEFAAVAVQLYEKWTGESPQADPTPFTDIAGNPCLSEIEKAYALDVTVGTSPTTFQPSINIPREQLATMLCRVYKCIVLDGWTYERDNLYSLDISGVSHFADHALISDFAQQSVYFMVKNHVMEGVGNNRFAPRASSSQEEALGYALATREQALVMSLRSLENLEQ